MAQIKYETWNGETEIDEYPSLAIAALKIGAYLDCDDIRRVALYDDNGSFVKGFDTEEVA